MHSRWAADLLAEKLRKPYVHILFGARQTGKTTLLRQLLPDPALAFNLADPSERGPLLADPGAFVRACRALPKQRTPHIVFVDEAQTVPAVFDGVQSLTVAQQLQARTNIGAVAASDVGNTDTDFVAVFVGALV